MFSDSKNLVDLDLVNKQIAAVLPKSLFRIK